VIAIHATIEIGKGNPAPVKIEATTMPPITAALVVTQPRSPIALFG
jgi:hypothetical protein